MQLPKNRKYTYADYLTWDDGERYELIDGVRYMMSPAPTTEHQRVFRELFNQLATYLKGKTCEVFSEPFDVRLETKEKNEKNDTVVQPDIAVICDSSIVDEKGCRGVPDMIIEILSPSTARHDQVTKFNKYLDVGVREYWIVNPELKTVQVYLLMDGKYFSRAYSDSDTVSVGVLEDCQIQLGEVFSKTRR